MDGGALQAAIGVWVVAVGAAIGSFLNVVIARVPAGESIVRPASRCPGCRAPIAWYDNVPLLSWLVLRGRCRRCGMSIPARYPLVELAGGAVAWLAWTRHGLSPAAVAEVALVDLLLALALVDLATWLLPNALTWPLIGAGLAAAAAGVAPAPSLSASAIGAAVGFAAFALVSEVGRLLTRKEALGFGDVWLLSGLGAWLGVTALLPVVLLASIQGSVYGLALIVLGRSEPGPPEPAEPDDGSDAVAPPPDAADGAGDADGPAPAGAGEDDEPWIPPRHAVPFGPFLVAAGLEWLYLADWITAQVPPLAIFR